MLQKKLSGFVLLATALAAVVCLGVSANAETIYQADFTYPVTSYALLNGQAPDIASGMYGGSASATWTATAGWATYSGTANLSNTSAGGTALLPFTPQTDLVYTLSTTLNVTAGGDTDWFALGFTQTQGSDWFDTGQQGWALYRNVSGENQAFFAGFDNPADIGVNTGEIEASIILDTRPALWTLEWKVDGTTVRTATAYSVNPTINYVCVGSMLNRHVGGYIDDFTLTAVPEPGTLTILFAGLIVLPAFVWFRKR